MYCMCKINKEVTLEELKELCVLMEAQQTTDSYKDTELLINGDYAKIEVAIDEDGNVTLL